MNVESIKRAIVDLPTDEKTSLAAWLGRLDGEEWDGQMEADFAPGGAGRALLEEAEAAIEDGGAEPLDELLAEMRARRDRRRLR